MEDEPSPPSEPHGASESPGEKALGPGAMAFLTLGVAAAGSLVAGGLIGYLVDDWAGTSPVFTLVGLGVGIVAAVMMTVARVRKYL